MVMPMNTKILTGSVAGSVMMTLFSYVIDREKEIPLYSLLEGKVNKPGGLFIHLGAGFLFTSLYDIIWKNTKLKPTAATGLTFGGVNGLMSMILWRMITNARNNQQKLYRNLFLAHLMFGMSSAIGYRLGGRIKAA
jgi:hypothetical protein